jgi:hypothetical protein
MRSLPPALQEFRKIINHVTVKTCKSGKPAIIITQDLIRTVKATWGKDSLSPAELTNKAIELYNANPSKWINV